jgi:hypothetical protein
VVRQAGRAGRTRADREVKAHQVIANGMPSRAARTTNALATASHSSAKPITQMP